MHKIVNNDAPTYLSELHPNRVNESTSYDLRYGQLSNTILMFMFFWLFILSINLTAGTI